MCGELMDRAGLRISGNARAHPGKPPANFRLFRRPSEPARPEARARGASCRVRPPDIPAIIQPRYPFGRDARVQPCCWPGRRAWRTGMEDQACVLGLVVSGDGPSQQSKRPKQKTRRNAAEWAERGRWRGYRAERHACPNGRAQRSGQPIFPRNRGPLASVPSEAARRSSYDPLVQVIRPFLGGPAPPRILRGG